MSTKRKTPDFLNGVPELLLLQLLSRRPMYGYELVQAIGAATGRALEFGEGSVYPALHRLEADKLLRGRRETVQGRSRVVYHVTPAGHRRLGESVATWRRVAEAITAVLEGSTHAPPAVAGTVAG